MKKKFELLFGFISASIQKKSSLRIFRYKIFSSKCIFDVKNQCPQCTFRELLKLNRCTGSEIRL